MPDRPYRRTIAELLVRYDLEPSIHDVYVEGQSDRTLLELGLNTLAPKNTIKVYAIETVDVPGSLLERRDLAIGNKGRVITLADELWAQSSRDLQQRVICLADLDLDGILGRCRNYKLLIYTSDLSLDLVLTEAAVLDKLLSIVLLGFPLTAAELKKQMLPVLNEILLQRLAADELKITVDAPPFNKLCRFDGVTLQFMADEYVKRYLNKASCIHLEDKFREYADRFRSNVSSFPNKYVHMEDFLELLHFCVRRVKPRLVPEYDHFRRFMFGFAEAETIARLSEVREIIVRFGTA